MLPSWYPSRLQPTNGNFIEQHIKAIALHCKVSVLFLESDRNLRKGQVEKKYSEPYGIPTWRFYYAKTNCPLPLIKDLIQFKRFLSTAWSGYNTLIAQRGEPDLLHLHVLWRAGILAFLWKKLKNLHYVISEHSTRFLTVHKNEWPSPTQKLIQRIGISAAYLLPVSNSLKESMISAGLVNKYSVVPNVVDPAVFYPAKKRPIYPFTFLHVSNLRDEQKNFSGIITAVEKLVQHRTDFVIKVVCDSLKITEFQTLVNEKGLAPFIEFFPGQAYEGVAEMMRSSHCFLMFSNYETFGIVLAEALMCGLPSIFTDSGGVGSEIKSGKAGIQLKPGDVSGLCQSMDYMMENYGAYEPDVIAGDFSLLYNPSKVGQIFYNIYQEVLDS